MAKCEYVACMKDAEDIRTVNAPHGHAWTVNVCEFHAKALDEGMPMTVYVYALGRTPVAAT